MIKIFKLNILLLQTLFLYFFLLTPTLMGIEKIYKRDFVSNYFSGVVALADNDYEESYNFLKSIENLETTHLQYSRSYVETLVNNFKINEGFRYSINLKKKN